MTDDGVCNFIQPMNTVQGQPGINNLVIFLLDLAPVDIEDHRKDEDKRPVEVLRASDLNLLYQVHGFLRTVTPENKFHVSSFSFLPYGGSVFSGLYGENYSMLS